MDGPEATSDRESQAPPPGIIPPPPEPEPPRRRPGGLARRLVVSAAIMAAAFLVGVGVFNAVIMPAFVGHKSEVAVPNLVGKPLETAESLLSGLGLKLGDTRQRNDPRPIGTIAAQHPGPGTRVKQGRAVAVIISLGERQIVVPKLAGQSVRNAQLALESAGLKIGDQIQAPSDDVTRDLVVATEPPAGAPAPRGAPVNLLVSAGRPAADWMMPDFRGESASDLEPRLTGAGFIVTIEAQDGGTPRARGRIVDHRPSPGARVRPGDAITLYTE